MGRGLGGKSKHHIIFAFIFYRTKLCFVYNVNFVALQLLSHSQLFVTPWTVARQAPMSMEFSRQDYWIGLPFPTPRDLPNQGIESMSFHLLHWQVDYLLLCHLPSSLHNNNIWLLGEIISVYLIFLYISYTNLLRKIW